MLDFFRRERPWGQFIRLVERLPHWGHYKSQLAMDEEWARYVCDQEDKAERERMSGLEDPVQIADEPRTPFGYSDVISRLELIADRLLLVHGATVANYTKDHKAPEHKPIPSPETAVERERERRVRVELNELDALFAGDGLTLFE